VKVEDHLGNSDHNVLRWNLIHTLKLKKDKKITRQYHKGKYVGMRKWLGNIEWEAVMSKCSLEEKWSKFCEKN
jgi:hypothetical protein